MEPDYSNYSLSELQEALSSIDKEKHPSRVTIIEKEIAKREPSKTGSPTKIDSSQKNEFGFGKRLLIFVIGILLLLYGIDAFFEDEISWRNDIKYNLLDHTVEFYSLVSLYIGLGGLFVILSIFGKAKK